ncbi:MAG TPA: hypothetical protein VIL29_01965 [Pseudothermotoga sp.]|uniref:hypothetical protein n=1 Tax=Thermotoga profunda TaxID=1508420 RepID=UPI0005975F28|nr:hypothetical protein [Thermotoga profunda]
MKNLLFVWLIVPTCFLAAVVNLDFALGSYSWFGLTVSPYVEFWRVQADLAFTLGFVGDSSGLKVLPIYEPFDNLKYFSLDLDNGGVRYVVPYSGWLSYSNLEYQPHTLSLWGFNGSVGFVLKDNYALFFKVPHFSVCVDSDSGYHLGIPVKFGDLQIEPFVSNYGYGIGIVLGEFSGFFVPNMGFRVSLGSKRLFFFGQYLAGETNIGFGWFNKDEWVLITTESIDVRKKIDQIYLILNSQKERWYAGFSFPVFW